MSGARWVGGDVRVSAAGRAYRDADGRVRPGCCTLAAGRLASGPRALAPHSPGSPPPVGPAAGRAVAARASLPARLAWWTLDARPRCGAGHADPGEVIAALVAPAVRAGALYDVAGWASSAAVADCSASRGIAQRDRLGRRWTRSPRCRTDPRQARPGRRGPLRGRPVTAALDMTAVRFTGGSPARAGAGLGRRPHHRPPSDHAGIPRAGVAVSPAHPGGSRGPCFAEALERIRALAPPGVVCVIDSGSDTSQLCAADARLRFVVALRADPAGELVRRRRPAGCRAGRLALLRARACPRPRPLERLPRRSPRARRHRYDHRLRLRAPRSPARARPGAPAPSPGPPPGGALTAVDGGPDHRPPRRLIPSPGLDDPPPSPARPRASPRLPLALSPCPTCPPPPAHSRARRLPLRP